ncbi:MAG TPA: N-acetylmuramoyl-L-alanine amidase, partial [Thermoanaerobaculia bacterium]|nr:N-acetylmuramoyl-L-alanine amidase [Thermoanaerobaculia bacterium]
IWLEVLPERGEGLSAFARRLCGTTAVIPQLARANRGSRRLLAGVRYRVPFALLRPEIQVRAVRELFPSDRAEPDAWRHVAIDVGRRRAAPLEKVSEWFTGSAKNAGRLRAASALGQDRLAPGAEVRIPAELLVPAFRALLPPPPVVAKAVPPPAALALPPAVEAGSFRLEFGEDASGRFALYRLRQGEALYSAVVVRFTGRLHAEDVIGLANEIAARSGILDVTDIPVGYPVKVPLDLLLPEFLPADDPRRREYESQLSETAKFRNEVTARGLAGITVILDAGHGGADVGALVGGTWESIYVYDVMLRVRQLLAEKTLATVHATTRDGREFKIHDADVLPVSRGHQVMTTPPYLIADSTVGVHLRWYLANSLYRRALAASPGARDEKAVEKVVFLSIHADSLHPSVRGATVYIPSAEKVTGTLAKTGSVFTSRREVQEAKVVRFSHRDRVRAEGLSRQLGERLVATFRASGLAVHPFKPVRETIIRNRRAWVPAVLRYNEVPARVLLEVCNLSNPDDRRLLRTREFRQQVAEAVVAALLDSSDVEGAAALPATARAAR